MKTISVSRHLLGAAAAVTFAASSAGAQTPASPWPNQPVRMILPVPAGSAPDVLARLVGVKLTEKWGQSVIVDNRPGGSGVIGMNALLSGPTDGSTFGFVQGSAISVAPSTIKGVAYDFDRDFVPVTLAAVAPFVLSVPTNSPYKTLADFIAAAKSKPESIEVADTGRGTLPHLVTAKLGLLTGAQFLEVHYPGGAQSMHATLGGQTKMVIDTYNVVAGNVQGGKLRVLASTGDRAYPGLEQVPLANQTAPGAVAYGWFAIIAKKGVPPAVLVKFNKDLNEVLNLPEVVAKSQELGVYPRPGTPEQLTKYIAEDRKNWQHVLDARDIKPD
ncbi:Bug family tripartite tricarboxylate transporter substrate binding protein [Variovorax paradoxus]|uniref:Bug family tripartite tricarboxylate transporter substrate binding protein n=1 Tax=Variovorax paradoxus TaxID=34073 RepID=UPI0027808AB4|nr:tripartite tricarboxylate transporter substrate binding protein [Variovorax paradoxus]MDP9927839.1 tripartite-type tricarboxylate transporter receptor subunit TctC [Variovorax paradoxus]